MVVQYLNTLFLTGRTFREETNAARTLEQCLGQPCFVQIRWKDAVVPLDLTRMLHREPRVDYSQTLQAFLDARLTDLVVARYTTALVPRKDPVTGKYPARLDVTNALADSGITVSYTSAKTPTVRDDPYQRDALNDLVITAPTRSLANTLVAVNGVFHKTIQYGNELFVLDGFANMKNAKAQEVTLIDTSAVGGHQVIGIDAVSVANTAEQNPWNGVYLSFPERINFTNKTVLLVVDGYLYALDDCYEVVGERQIKIHSPRIDYINNWLHNPNTAYLTDGDGRDINPYTVEHDEVVTNPTVSDTIEYFLQHIWPIDRAAVGNPHTVLMGYEYTNFYRSEPTQQEAMEYLVSQLSAIADGRAGSGADTVLGQIKYTQDYATLTEIAATLPLVSLTTPEFVMGQILSKHSFVIAINNPHLYVRRYRAQPRQTPNHYEVRSADTPRGILRYANHKAIPYTLTSAEDGQHVLYVNHQETATDVYKTGYQQKTITSPVFDVHATTQRHELEMLELYAP